MARICVYCGSSPGLRPAYTSAAEDLGEYLGSQGHELVYGGGHVGLMGSVADAALKAGGRVI
ncbi:MAG: TIGR00730 family Rossman fold protein, partial [Verrucomicrobiota bacterium]